MSGLVGLVLSLILFLHKRIKLFDAGRILTFVPAFPSGLVMLFWLEIIFFSLVEGPFS